VPVAVLSAAALLAGASSAPAAFSVSGVTVTPSTTQAAAHPNVTVTTTFSGDDAIGGGGVVSDTPRTVRIHLGPGLIGNPLAAPTCPVATFRANACPADTVVGSSALSFVIVATSGTATLPGVVYNVATDSPDQAAQLGVQTLAPNPAVGPNEPPLIPVATTLVPVTISPSDYGLDSTTADDLTASTMLTGPIRVTSLAITLNGAAANGFYMTNPTACIPVGASATATSYGGTTSSASAAPFTPTDCATEPFGVGLAAALDTTRTDTPAQVGVTLSTAADGNPRRNAHVLASTVTLPKGMTINPSLGVGLAACTDAQFAASNRAVAAACPAASRIGTVTFRSPSFAQAFTGPVYFGTPTATAANRLLVDVPIPGVHLKLVGRTQLNPADGQVTTTFENLPQIPFTAFTLTFRGGPHAVLITPTTCGPQALAADVTPYARLTDPTPPNARPTASFTTSFDGAGAACVRRFRPYFTSTLSNGRAGASGAYTLRFARPDRDARFARVAFRLPAGLAADLTLGGLTKCPLATAARGACPASSRVGSASIDVGSGPAPATLPGSTFLTAPKAAGDPAGLSIRVPATLGPVSLGDVIVGVKLRLRSNGGLDVTSDPLPQFIGGVPISIRSATLRLDRRGFVRNPTSCGRKHHSATYDALGGGRAESSAAFTLSGCERLRFKPRIAVSLGAKGKTRPGAHPPLTTTIRQEAGEAAIRRVHVRLPKALSTNLTSVNAACTQAAFDAGTCKRSARVASATAHSPLIAGKVTGRVLLVRQERGKLPKLVVQLRDPIALTFEGFVNVGRGGGVGTTFPRVPDLPVTSFALTFHGGRFGALTNVRNLCARRLRFPAGFTGRNDKVVKRRPVIAVKGCRG